jgi:hypothetical protein
MAHLTKVVLTTALGEGNVPWSEAGGGSGCSPGRRCSLGPALQGDGSSSWGPCVATSGGRSVRRCYGVEIEGCAEWLSGEEAARLTSGRGTTVSEVERRGKGRGARF